MQYLQAIEERFNALTLRLADMLESTYPGLNVPLVDQVYTNEKLGTRVSFKYIEDLEDLKRIPSTAYAVRNAHYVLSNAFETFAGDQVPSSYLITCTLAGCSNMYNEVNLFGDGTLLTKRITALLEDLVDTVLAPFEEKVVEPRHTLTMMYAQYLHKFPEHIQSKVYNIFAVQNWHYANRQVLGFSSKGLIPPPEGRYVDVADPKMSKEIAETTFALISDKCSLADAYYTATALSS